MSTTIGKARDNLMLVCSIFTGAILLLIFSQIIFGNVYDGIQNEIWGWFTQSVTPIFTLMLGSYIALPTIIREKDVNLFLFRLTYWFIFLYFILCFLVIISVALPKTKILDTIKNTSVIMGIIQTALCGLLGVFFAKD